MSSEQTFFIIYNILLLCLCEFNNSFCGIFRLKVSISVHFIFVQHDGKAGSKKNYSGDKLLFSGYQGTRIFRLPVCIIQGPLLAAVGLVMKAA